MCLSTNDYEGSLLTVSPLVPDVYAIVKTETVTNIRLT